MTRQFTTLAMVSLITTLVTSTVQAVPLTSPFMGDLEFWTRADQGVTLNSGRVSAWNDLSGNGNHVGQATAGQQPLFVSSAINSLPAVRFVRSRGDLLNNTIANIMAGTSARTIFVVGDARSAGEGGPTNVGNSLFTFRSTTLVGNYSQGNVGGSHFVYSDGVNSANNATLPLAATTTISSAFISMYQADQPNQLVVSLNSILQTVTQPGGVMTETGTTGFTIGNREDQAATSFGWDGDIAEILIYDRLLTADEINHTGTYLAERYGVTAPNFDFVIQVPEPSSFLLLGLGILGLVRHTRRRRCRA